MTIKHFTKEVTPEEQAKLEKKLKKEISIKKEQELLKKIKSFDFPGKENETDDSYKHAIQLEIKAEDWYRMWAYTLLYPEEISGVGITKLERAKGRFFSNHKIVLENLLPLADQVNTSVSTDTSEEELSQLFKDQNLDDDQINRCSFWWHSHVNMSAYFSPTDDETISRWSYSDFRISIVFNKKGEFQMRYDSLRPLKCTVDYIELSIVGCDIKYRATKEDSNWSAVPKIPYDIYRKCQDEIDLKCKRNKPTTSTSNYNNHHHHHHMMAAYGYGYGDDYHDYSAYSDMYTKAYKDNQESKKNKKQNKKKDTKEELLDEAIPNEVIPYAFLTPHQINRLLVENKIYFNTQVTDYLFSAYKENIEKSSLASRDIIPEDMTYQDQQMSEFQIEAVLNSIDSKEVNSNITSAPALLYDEVVEYVSEILDFREWESPEMISPRLYSMISFLLGEDLEMVISSNFPQEYIAYLAEVENYNNKLFV